MNTRTLVLAAATAAALTLGGCANNAQLGTGVGAVAGGVVGDAVLGGTLGTVGGAAAGALIGNEVGKRSDQRR
ncbi:glycine zipper domain-containing protein [Pantoea sp. 18069]|uniref:glycine zipper domain-containing protein n=1 Tax=Pantoea sp. 18069 TaxID=2681415 RepID=UPI001359C319|nr:glycine zipper domain-containing protein [Pantoea sp. 18069]